MTQNNPQIDPSLADIVRALQSQREFHANEAANLHVLLAQAQRDIAARDARIAELEAMSKEHRAKAA